MLTDMGAATVNEQTIDIDMHELNPKLFGKIAIPLPQATVRIVSFKVEPRSIPNTLTCDEDSLPVYTTE